MSPLKITNIILSMSILNQLFGILKLELQKMDILLAAFGAVLCLSMMQIRKVRIF